jgi:hypothetical protein
MLRGTNVVSVTVIIAAALATWATLGTAVGQKASSSEAAA